MSNENAIFINNMMTFLGLPNDDRVRLYIDALKDAFNNDKPLVLTNEMKQLRSENFSVLDPFSTSGDSIHSEWSNFKADMLNPKTLDLNLLLSFVQKNAGLASHKSNKQFIHEFIKAHVNIKDQYNNDITNNVILWGSAKEVISDNNKLQAIFINVTMGAPNIGHKRFSFNLSKKILHELLEKAAEPRSNGVDNFWDSNIGQEKDSYYRLDSNRNLLFTTDASGNSIDVSAGSNAYNNLKDDQCMGTKVKKNHPTLKCSDYISKCIAGNTNDITACKEFMQDKTFWDVVPKEVNDMLPSIAEHTLNSFGFRIVPKNDLRQYESVGSWSRGLDNKELNDNEIKQIRTNTKLMQYLEMLVDKINSNPAILNKQYNAGYNFDPTDHTSRFSSWSLTARGMRPRVIFKNMSNQQINIIRQIGLITSSLLNIRSLANNRVAFIPGSGLVIRGIPIAVSSPLSFMQIGGASVQMVSAVPNDDIVKEHYPLLKNLLDASEKMLQSKGKSIDGYTKQQIEQHLESYRRSEEKLIKAIKYSDKYIDLLDIYKEYDSENILSMDHLKSFVEARESYFDKTIGKQNDLLSAVERIVTTVNESLDKNMG
jgi:hypothetical protein